MRIRLTPEAKADLLNALRHIAADSPRNAALINGRIEGALERLVTLPNIGRVGRVEGTRERPVSRTPYLLIYRVIDSEVEILRILHGRRRWPPP